MNLRRPSVYPTTLSSYRAADEWACPSTNKYLVRVCSSKYLLMPLSSNGCLLLGFTRPRLGSNRLLVPRSSATCKMDVTSCYVNNADCKSCKVSATRPFRRLPGYAHVSCGDSVTLSSCERLTRAEFLLFFKFRFQGIESIGAYGTID